MGVGAVTCCICDHRLSYQVAQPGVVLLPDDGAVVIESRVNILEEVPYWCLVCCLAVARDGGEFLNEA